jgi:TonB family protein
MTAQPGAAAGGAGGNKPQPVAVEIPVTVNGASTIAGSEKREPFSESTQTVLVFGSGAVIRLAAAVGPGQLLFVTNEKTRKEVVCQVVKSKQNGGAGGYVELKFTEAAADFWGIRFPGGPAAPAPAVSVPAAAPVAPVKPPEPKLEEKRNLAPLAPPDPQPALKLVPKPVTVISTAPVSAAKSTMPAEEWKATTVVATEEPGTRSNVPTLSEFLTHGSNGLELRAPERPQATKAVPAAEDLPLPSAPKDAKPGLGAALGATLNPAVATATFDLAAEEVKIPSWLEPLARNSASPAETKADGASTEPRAIEALSDLSEGSASSQEQSGILTLSSEGRAPNFGSSLPLGAGAEQSKRSGKGWKIVLLILALVLGAAAAWYWYINQPPKVSASGNSDAAGGLETIPAPALETGSTASQPRAANVSPASLSQSFEQPAAAPINTGTAASAGRAVINATRTNHAEAPAAAAEPARKPALGNVQLAAPVVARKDVSADNTSADPGLALNGVTSGDPGSLSLLNSKGNQPAAPLPIGGDVIPAHLLSSVPPVYPQLARTQRLSGDVVLDALIDQNGRVSATKVISGPNLLHQPAMDAVKQWKYQPATLNGQATSMHLMVTVQFRLQ